jgi:hypothetical protein
MATARAVPPETLAVAKKNLAEVQRDAKEHEDEIDYFVEACQAWQSCEGFFESIRNLPAQEQADRVLAKMNELHDTDVAGHPEFANGVLISVRLKPDT